MNRLCVIAAAVFWIALNNHDLLHGQQQSSQAPPPVDRSAIPPFKATPSPPVTTPQGSPGKTRKSETQGKRIVDYLEPGEADVVVERFDFPPDYVLPPGFSQLGWATVLRPVALTVSLDRVGGAVTADQTWIESTLTGTVVQVLKNSSPVRLSPGSPVALVALDGVIAVGSRRVEARGHGRKAFERGTYLVLASVRESDGALLTSARGAFRIDGKALEPMIGAEESIVDHKDAERAIDEVFRHAQVQNPFERRRVRK